LNPEDFGGKETLQFVHLHPVDNKSDEMAVSPNNGAFLLNLTMPVVNFTLVLHYANQLSIFNVTMNNDDQFAQS